METVFVRIMDVLKFRNFLLSLFAYFENFAFPVVMTMDFPFY